MSARKNAPTLANVVTAVQGLVELHEEAMEAILSLGSRIGALETPAPTPAPKARRGKAAAAKAAVVKSLTPEQVAHAARTLANKAAGRMSTARFACTADTCKFASYNEAPSQAHVLKTGHAVETL